MWSVLTVADEIVALLKETPGGLDRVEIVARLGISPESVLNALAQLEFDRVIKSEKDSFGSLVFRLQGK